MQARFDKQGRPLPDTGRGCGCQQCADAKAPRYERRSDSDRATRWSALRRTITRVAKTARAWRPVA